MQNIRKPVMIISYSLIEDCVSLDKLLNGGISVTLDLSNLSSNTEAMNAIESASNLQFFCPVRKLMICDSCGRRSSTQSIEKCEFCASPYLISCIADDLNLKFSQMTIQKTLICNLVHRSLKSPCIFGVKVSYSNNYWLVIGKILKNFSTLSYDLNLKTLMFLVKLPRILMQVIRSCVFFRKLMLLSRSPCIGLVIARIAKMVTDQKSYSDVSRCH